MKNKVIDNKLLNISPQNLWFRSNKYEFINDEYIGIKDAKSQKLEFFDVWNDYLKKKQTGNQIDLPHIEFLKIGKFSQNEAKHSLCKRIGKLEKILEDIKKKLSALDDGDYLNNAEFEKIKKKLSNLDIKIKNSDLEEKPITEIINSELDIFRVEKKKLLRKMVLDFVNKYGLLGEYFEEINQINLEPQWLPYVLTSQKRKTVTEMIEQSSNHKTIIEPTKLDDKKFVKITNGNFEFKQKVYVNLKKANNIKKVYFYPKDYNNIPWYDNINFGLFQPIVTLTANEWKINFKFLDFDDVNKKHKNKILKEIKDADLTYFQFENRVFSEKKYLDLFPDDKIKRKNYAKYFDDNNNSLFVISPSNIDNGKYSDLVNYSKDQWRFYRENFNWIIEKANQLYNFFKCNETYRDHHNKNKVIDKLTADNAQKKFFEIQDNLTKNISISHDIRNQAKSKLSNNFKCSSLLGLLVCMAIVDFRDPDNILKKCEYRNCLDYFFTTNKEKKHCCENHRKYETKYKSIDKGKKAA